MTASDKMFVITEIMGALVCYRLSGITGGIGFCLGSLGYHLWSVYA